MDTMSRASLEQEIYLRALTGYISGSYLFDGYKKVAMIVYPDRICSSMADSAMVAYIAKHGYKENLGMICTYEEGKEKEMIEKIMKFMPDVIFIVFGGEQKMSYVLNITKKVLESLADSGCKANLAIHVRTWLAIKKLSIFMQDEKIKKYLQSLKEIRTFEVDINNKKMIFYKVKVEEDKVLTEKYHEEKLNDEHISLLKISLPPAE